MEIRSFYKAVMNGVSFPLAAFGGVEPYTWSIEPTKTIGGTISPTGDYTAPAQKNGIDRIVVTDSTPVTPLKATYDVNVGTAFHMAADIIKTELGLADDQIFLYNTKFNPPKDERMYVAINPLTLRVFGSSNKVVDGGEGSLQSVNVFAPVDVTIYSRSTEALLRKEEVVMALDSNYARSQQELNGFYIGKVSGSMVNLNLIEGAAIPYMFNIQVNLQYKVTKQSAVPYFDTFDAIEVKTNP